MPMEQQRHNFNCTIQELKPWKRRLAVFKTSLFQLHHTGIKTSSCKAWRSKARSFQLHHTGIKTGT